MAQIIPLVIVSFAGALIGWAMVVLTSRIERRRQQRHTERFGQPQVPESPALTQRRPWIRFLGRWLLP
jgi:hypothetical protein